MAVKQVQLATLWGLTRARVSQLCKAGMPLDSVEAAEAWRGAYTSGNDGNKNVSLSEKGGADQSVGVSSKKPTKAELKRTDLKGVLARMRKAEVDAWSRYDLAEGEVVRASLLKTYKEAAGLRVKAESEVIELEQRVGNLVPFELAKETVREQMVRVVKLLRGLPASAAVRCNPSDPEMAREQLEDMVRNIFKSMGVSDDR